MHVKNDPRVIFHWAMYDWANSAYATTVVAALLPAYFTQVVVGEGGVSVLGVGLAADVVWGYLTGGWAMILFLLSPLLGAIADFSASKRRFLAVFAYGGALCAMLMFFLQTGDVALTALVFVLAQVGFISANVFYDGFLPDITTAETIDSVSSRGYAFGYVGGGIQLALSLALVTQAEALGLETGLAVRLAIAMAGVWWIGFTAFALSGLGETGVAQPLPAAYRSQPEAWAYVRLGFDRTLATVRQIRRFPHLVLFLVAYMIYNDGVQTMNNMASAYASVTLELSAQTILTVFLISQLSAFPGALLFGSVAGRVGAQRAIIITLVLWTLVAAAAYRLTVGDAFQFQLLAIAAGFAQGGNQALSRSLYGSMIPEAASAEFYGFYSVFAKFSAIWGPLLFGVIGTITGSARYSILFLTVFFVVGALLLARVDVEAARRSKEMWDLDVS